MDEGKILQRRRSLNETTGDAFLADPEAQRELGFRWNGTTIEDELLPLPFEYFYPSTIGMSLFYHGGFEAGEIAFTNSILAQLERPVILDVGANIGLHCVSWCVKFPDAQIYAFEPVQSNREVLERNAGRSCVGDRIALSEAAISDREGTATFYECADAAYSTLRSNATMPIAQSYDVRTTTIDKVVAERNIPRVDLLKIDAEGLEAEILAGAEGTLLRDRPFLFVEVGTADGKQTADRTIQWLLDRQYNAYVISDGIVTNYWGADDDVHNYFFAHPSRAIELPPTNPSIARDEAKYRAVLIRTARRQLVHLRAELKRKDDEIRRLKSAADERLALINRLSKESSESDAEKLQRRTEQLEEVAAAEQRYAMTLQTKFADQAKRIQALEAQLAAQAAGGSVPVEGIKELRAEAAVQQRAAAERLALIQDMEKRMREMGARAKTTTKAYEELSRMAKERAETIERLQRGIEQREGDFRAQVAIIAKLEEMIRGTRGEETALRDELARMQARVDELEALASERLEVIQALNRGRKLGTTAP